METGELVGGRIEEVNEAGKAYQAAPIQIDPNRQGHTRYGPAWP